MSADCRTIAFGQHIDRHIGQVSVEISADISVDMSVYMSTDTSRSIYRPSVGRASVDMSSDTRPICRSTCRPIYRSRGVQNKHDPKLLDHVYFVHPSTDISVDISIECRSTYRPMLGRYIDRDVSVDKLTDISVEISADISVDMSVDMSPESCCPTVGRHVDR